MFKADKKQEFGASTDQPNRKSTGQESELAAARQRDIIAGASFKNDLTNSPLNGKVGDTSLGKAMGDNDLENSIN